MGGSVLLLIVSLCLECDSFSTVKSDTTMNSSEVGAKTFLWVTFTDGDFYFSPPRGSATSLCASFVVCSFSLSNGMFVLSRVPTFSGTTGDFSLSWFSITRVFSTVIVNVGWWS